jgi:hypothetical protein
MNSFNNIYLHGNLEYYPNDKLSVRSDSYVFLNALSSFVELQNHSNFTGISYHFTTKKQFDPYITFQPGIAYVKVAPVVAISLIAFPEISGWVPLYSSAIGFNYYAKKYFHLFMEARYVRGELPAYPVAISLNELKLSFGLGFNLRVKKPKGIKTGEDFKS